MVTFRIIGIVAAVILWNLSQSASAFQGLAIHGNPKYNGKTHVEYAKPDAPKGGRIIIGWEGDFDSINPYALKGISPLLLSTLVFMDLGNQTLDEPFSQYPLIAESFDLAPDRMSLTVKLNKMAKFSDGQPITAKDVKFSLDLFRSKNVAPWYASYWADIKDLQIKGDHEVVFTFQKLNQELPLITTQLPILPQHIYGKGDFNKDYIDKATGSGPYVVKEYDRGKFITYKRDPNHWAKDHPLFKGRFNFDEITVKYYKDSVALVEAFKKGEFDFFSVASAKTWAVELGGDRFEKLRWIRKELWPNQNNQEAQIFLFNMRRPIFTNIHVRQAIALAFDFEWSNKTLFYGQYTSNSSFFENSELKANGMPSDKELKILEPLQKEIPQEVFTKEIGWLSKGMDIRGRLKTARDLLLKSGYQVRNGILVNAKGEPLKFSFLLNSPGFARVLEPYIANLKKLGIEAKMEQREPSIYQNRIDAHDFDMIVESIPQSLSPGNEQIDYWTSSAADKQFSQNYAGLKNIGIDKIVNSIVYAKTRDELVTATRALDRVLYHLHIGVHNWHMPAHRVSFWDRFGHPAIFPKYYSPVKFLEFLWVDPDKDAKLAKAKETNSPL